MHLEKTVPWNILESSIILLISNYATKMNQDTIDIKVNW